MARTCAVLCSCRDAAIRNSCPRRLLAKTEEHGSARLFTLLEDGHRGSRVAGRPRAVGSVAEDKACPACLFDPGPKSGAVADKLSECGGNLGDPRLPRKMGALKSILLEVSTRSCCQHGLHGMPGTALVWTGVLFPRRLARRSTDRGSLDLRAARTTSSTSILCVQGPVAPCLPVQTTTASSLRLDDAGAASVRPEARVSPAGLRPQRVAGRASPSTLRPQLISIRLQSDAPVLFFR